MTKIISREKGEIVALAILEMDVHWAEIFQDLGMIDINYCDLFMQIWLAKQTPLTKTTLYAFMPGMSRRTAVKYVQNLVDGGWLIEQQAEDKRVKFVSLAPEINRRLERFLSFAFNRLSQVSEPTLNA